MTILGGGKLDAAELAGLPHDGTLDSAIATAASGFTIASQGGRLALNGLLVSWTISVTTTSAITATTGNIADTTIATLDPEYAPTEAWGFSFQNTAVSGAGSIGTDGTIVIRAASDTIAAGTTMRISACYLRGV